MHQYTEGTARGRRTALKTRTLCSRPPAHALKYLSDTLLKSSRTKEHAAAAPTGTAITRAPLVILPLHILEYVDDGDENPEHEWSHHETYETE
jgi:hypothetical protein